MIKIAIIMTIFNRCEKTKKCIQSLLNNYKKKYQIDFYITNDGSTDHTLAVLKSLEKENPNSKFWIYNGQGNLFWCRGMHVSYGEALKYNYDFFIWVNNDVEFLDNFIDSLLLDYEKAKLTNSLSIITGAMRWNKSEEVSYGGGVYKSKLHLTNILIKPNGNIQECRNINGNCLLIPQDVAFKLGNIEKEYEHGFGDFDYGYRLLAKGGKPYVSSKFVGICDRNNKKGTWEDINLSRRERLELLKSTKGLPTQTYKLFLKRWFPKIWFIHYIKPYVKIIFKR